MPGKAAEHRSLALCIALLLSDLCFSGGGGRGQNHPRGLFSIPESRARPVPAGPQAAARQIRKITFTGRKAGVSQPCRHRIQRVYKQKESESPLVFIRVILATGAFDPASQGSGRFKELRGIRKPPRSFCRGKARQVRPSGGTEPTPGHGDTALCAHRLSVRGHWLCLTNT